VPEGLLLAVLEPAPTRLDISKTWMLCIPLVEQPYLPQRRHVRNV
jgi:hypothetical protein